MKPNKIEHLRYYSRELIRELGFLDNPYKPFDLNFAKVHLLLECELQGYVTQQGLAKVLRLNKSYVSKLVKVLEDKGLLIVTGSPNDKRENNISLSPEGGELVSKINIAAQAQVLSALKYLDKEEVTVILQGLNLYGNALKKSRRLQDVIFRPIEKRDNANLSTLIKQVLTEFGANKPGFAFCDEELNSMYDSYQGIDRAYMVVEKENLLLGGIGFGPLPGADNGTVELQKMYLSRDARGLGLGDEMLRLMLANAAKKNYHTIYLETLSTMTQAIASYRRHGFEFLNTPMGLTGHFGCDTWMRKVL